MSRKSMGCATARLKQDYLRLKKDPVPYVQAEPVPSNILEWHYVITGPENTPYQGGYYHGKLVFPREFPFQPPSIYMITPNGRFKTNTRLCLSISDFHPDTWNPAWNVSTILIGLLSFMIENGSALGAITTLEYEKKVYAAQSLAFNLKDKLFCELFPETVTLSNPNDDSFEPFAVSFLFHWNPLLRATAVHHGLWRPLPIKKHFKNDDSPKSRASSLYNTWFDRAQQRTARLRRLTFEN
ncbi:unnamed protein product [Trichogramma brassicae]|uniref:Ubiquitin-conjugating enzyme E2 J2 n=1 Tax=Trichogramma brassicae TaxID=86971 RepID=A0A6H5J0W3_9HYME|nr:unnamed protein product [Trichogramma brassicae]